LAATGSAVVNFHGSRTVGFNAAGGWRRVSGWLGCADDDGPAAAPLGQLERVHGATDSSI